MRLGNRLALASIAVVALVCAGGAQGAFATRHSAGPPLITFNMANGKMVNGTLRFNLVMWHAPNFLTAIYPETRPRDIIPAVRLQLVLPQGVSLAKSMVVLSPANNGKFYPRYAATNFLWRVVSGHPTVVFRRLRPGVIIKWSLYLKGEDSSQQTCISATATFPGVKRAPTQSTKDPNEPVGGCYGPGA